MILTKQKLLLGVLGENEARDHIPLSEIQAISIKQDNDAGSSNNARGLLKKAETINEYRFFNGFQIMTVPDGYNSGRTYHMQADTKEDCNRIVSTIQKWAQKAEKAARNATRLEKSQKAMLRLYNSALFQTISSFLILSVSKALIHFSNLRFS